MRPRAAFLPALLLVAGILAASCGSDGDTVPLGGAGASGKGGAAGATNAAGAAGDETTGGEGGVSGSGGGASGGTAGAGGQGGDGPVARCDPTAPFGVPQLIENVNSDAEDHFGSMTADGLTLYFDSNRSGQYDLYRASRDTRAQVFGDPMPLPAPVNDPSARESEGIVSADGLSLFFMSSRNAGNFDIYVATRQTLRAEFDDPAPVANVNTDSDDAPSTISTDGERLYISSLINGNHDIFVAALGSSGSFGMPQEITELSTDVADTVPILTPNELTMYFTSERLGRQGDILVTRRTSLNSNFGDAEEVAELNSDQQDWATWISPDECEIILASNRAPGGLGSVDLYIAERPAP